MNEECRKIGIFGGTFDPVHEGHVSVARQLFETFHFSGLLFIPAAAPPHKKQPAASYAHRVAMLDIALRPEKAMAVSLIESERSAPSYTYDTLLELKKRLGREVQLQLIIGADAFVELHLWYRFTALLAETDIIVAARPDNPDQRIAKQVKRFPGTYVYDEKCRCWNQENKGAIYYYVQSSEPVSSTDIRRRLRHGEIPRDLLPDGVADYIVANRLYR